MKLGQKKGRKIEMFYFLYAAKYILVLKGLSALKRDIQKLL
jgi:hypothetical protein